MPDPSIPVSGHKHLVLAIELPCMYTADIDGPLREYKYEGSSESEYIVRVQRFWGDSQANPVVVMGPYD